MGGGYPHRIGRALHDQLSEQRTAAILHCMVFRLPALSGREVYRKQTPRQNTCAVYPHRYGNCHRCYRRRAVAHHPSDD